MKGSLMFYHFYKVVDFIALLVVVAIIITAPFYIGGLIEGWLGLRGVE